MHPQVAFILYLVLGSLLMFFFLMVCVRISVYIEDTCPTPFCVRRQQRKMRKKLIRRILHPDEPSPSSRPASPSEENITADIICQNYIYRDAYSTGLQGLGRTLATLPLTLTYSTENNPTASVSNAEHMRLIFRRMFPNSSPAADSDLDPPPDIELDSTSGVDGEDCESLPPPYSNLDLVIEMGDEALPPPPSYEECVKEKEAELQGSV